MKPGAAKPKRRINFWHLGFGDLLAERGSPDIRVVSELSLPVRVRRADFLLIRREDGQQRDRQARSLRALWPRLSDVTIMELKSPGRAFRPSELIRLVACGALYHEHNRRELAGPHALTLAVVFAWHHAQLARGNRVDALEIAEAEDDDYLRVFSDHEIRTVETMSWLDHWMMEKETMLDPKQIKPEGYDEMMQKLADRLTPEQRLRGLDDEQVLLALPGSVLRHLSEDYLRSLSPAVQKVVRERIERSR